MKITIDGPCTGSYSLALVNREMALALEALHPGRISLSFYSHPEPRPQNVVDQHWLAAHPAVDELWQRGRQAGQGTDADVVLFNSWPPLLPLDRFQTKNTDKAESLFLTNAYGWEESRFPPRYADSFNQSLHGLTVMSDFVAKTLVDNGVDRPIKNIGLGADHILRIPAQNCPGNLGAGYRFLHISSCFPRKGLDVLLEAYGRAFTAADAVSLVIKTFPNPHNQAAKQIAEFRRQHPSPPRIVLIDEDLPDGCLVDLYQRCHCLVAPSRGEGFGLPLAEAMLFHLPVITTGYGGQRDFCNPGTSRLIDYQLRPAATHLNPFGSVWAEPDTHHLVQLLRDQLHEDAIATRRRTDAAQTLIRRQFTWKACARRLCNFIESLTEQRRQRAANPWVTETAPEGHRPSVAMVTSWNVRCGIAEYARYQLPFLLDQLDVRIFAPRHADLIRADESNVVRLWQSDDFSEQIPVALEQYQIKRLIINFHFSFFPLPEFRQLLQALYRQKVAVTIIFHAVDAGTLNIDPLAPELARAQRLLVHNSTDLNRFEKLGLGRNTALLLHGVPALRHRPRPSAQVLPPGFKPGNYLATFGFLMPHKGIVQLIQAFRQLAPQYPDLHLLLLTSFYPKEEIMAHYQQCLDAIETSGLARRICLISEFLPVEEVCALLASACLVVYPYQHSAESSSAAVRMGLASTSLVAVTPLDIFADVQGAVARLPGTAPNALARGIHALLGNQQQRIALQHKQQQWLATYNWSAVGKTLAGQLRCSGKG